jgi:hypothetical protein
MGTVSGKTNEDCHCPDFTPECESNCEAHDDDSKNILGKEIAGSLKAGLDFH